MTTDTSLPIPSQSNDVTTDAFEIVPFQYPSSLSTVAIKLRIQVFCHEQGFCEDIEEDEFDPLNKTHHFIAYKVKDNHIIEPAGVIRVVMKQMKLSKETETVAKIGRLAVSTKYRSHGLASRLMNACEEFVREHYPKTDCFVLEAQTYIRDMYEKRYNYECVDGEIYDIEGVDHILMKKNL